MELIQNLHHTLQSTDAVVIGAGAGLSTSAGFNYNGERFQKYFSDFIEKYGFTDMYTAGFHQFPNEKEHWAYWSRHIYYNRYVPAPKPVYNDLPAWKHLAILLSLGYVAYGLSIFFYTLAQRGIGAAKTSTYYALAPFIGAFLSVVVLGEPIGWVFIVATLIMAAGCWLAGR